MATRGANATGAGARRPAARGGPRSGETSDRGDPIDDPARFAQQPVSQQQAILRWIGAVMRPAKRPSESTSYGLKHFCEDEVGFYVANGTMKGAMIAAGFGPVDPWAQNARYGVRPLRPSRQGVNQTLRRRCYGTEVYTLADADEAARDAVWDVYVEESTDPIPPLPDPDDGSVAPALGRRPRGLTHPLLSESPRALRRRNVFATATFLTYA